MFESVQLDRVDLIRAGDMHFMAREFPKAAKYYWQAISAPQDNFAQVLTKFGLAALRSGAPTACQWAIDLAFRIDPRDPYAHNVDALYQSDIGEFRKSAGQFEEAIRLMPDNPDFRKNAAYTFQILGRYDDAEREYKAACDLNPADLEARFYKSMTMLSQGRYAEGFKEYELRYAVYPDLVPKRGKPIWRGQELLDGKTLLLCAEQGAGDAIQFGRYIWWLKTYRGAARVILLCRPELVEICKHLEDIDGITTDPELIEYDYQAPMLSMPGLTMELDRTTAPWWGTGLPYLKVPPMEGVGSLWPFDGKFCVGFCWQGNPQHGNDRFRSIPAQSFNRFLDKGIVGVNLQHNLSNPSMYNPNPQSLLALAQIIDKLDLVITVDTAIAHIAGALGKPCWTMIASNPDWRWGIEGATTPWYPTMTLYRQKHPLQWGPVLEEMETDFEQMLVAKKEAANG